MSNKDGKKSYSGKNRLTKKRSRLVLIGGPTEPSRMIKVRSFGPKEPDAK